MKKAQATNREIGLAALILVVVALYLYLTTPHMPVTSTGQTFHEECELQGNLSCDNVLLRRESSMLEISIAQNTGKPISISSLVCTSKSGSPALMMPPLNNTVLINSGGRAYVSGGNSGNAVFCTGEDGESIPNASLGSEYYGNIYIAYIEVGTGTVGFVNGTLATKYS
jgi:hypothetical protein